MKILHLYPDLMNLYGEMGNLCALERRLTDQGETVVIDRCAPGQEPDFTGYDFIYMGAGTESGRLAALTALLPHADDLRRAMDNGVFALFTGNAGSVLARQLQLADGTTRPGLDLVDMVVQERGDKRIIGDVIVTHPQLDKPLVGFINHCDNWEGHMTPLLQMSMGWGNQKGAFLEGFRQNNFMGTHLIGPVLVKNPHFHNWLLEQLLDRKLVEKSYPHEEQAWQVTYTALSERNK